VKYDWVIVGAGLTGATLAERLASQRGARVLVVERRRHLAGNAYDHPNPEGLLVHRYGPHIFHTQSREVFDYLSRFTAWRPYVHRVLAEIQGRRVPLPFNLNTLHALYPRRLAERVEEKLVARFGHGARVPILKLKTADDPELAELAAFVYQNVFLGYTRKQWGLAPEELDPAVTGRVPVVVARDDRYFADPYQALPAEGYTRMVERMLAHPRIHLLLGADFKEIEGELRFDRLIYTGPIDAFFDYLHGPLPYRSLRFVWATHRTPAVQPVAVINYPNEHPFTRTTEYKHLTGQESPFTAISYEYPEAHEPGRNEPYYPIPREENRLRYRAYQKEAQKLKHVFFAGRLADYRYYNMDQAVARALKLFRELP